eukprot:scaffold2600_cov75-Phaeocystis_antarctica.AAC.1
MAATECPSWVRTIPRNTTLTQRLLGSPSSWSRPSRTGECANRALRAAGAAAASRYMFCGDGVEGPCAGEAGHVHHLTR